MKLELSAGLLKLAVGIASASILGGGTMVLNSAKDNSEQDIKIEHVEKRQDSLDSTLSKLDEAVRNLDKNVAVLNEQMKE